MLTPIELYIFLFWLSVFSLISNLKSVNIAQTHVASISTSQTDRADIGSWIRVNAKMYKFFNVEELRLCLSLTSYVLANRRKLTRRAYLNLSYFSLFSSWWRMPDAMIHIFSECPLIIIIPVGRKVFTSHDSSWQIANLAEWVSCAQSRLHLSQTISDLSLTGNPEW